MKRNMGWMILAFLVLYIGFRVWPYLYYRQVPADIFALKLMEPKLPDDLVYQQLDQLGCQVTLNQEPDDKRVLWERSIEELQATLAANRSALEAWAEWKAAGGDPMTAATLGRHSRVAWPEYNEGSPMHTNFKALHRLMMAQALVGIELGNKEQTQQALHDSLMVAEFLGQNASWLTLTVSCSMYSDLTYLLTAKVPDDFLDEQLLQALPEPNRIRTQMEQAIWLEMCNSSKMIENIEKYMDPSQRWTFRLLGGLHKGHTLQLVYDQFEWALQQIAGPLGETKDQPFTYKKGTAFTTFNPAGKIITDVIGPNNRTRYTQLGFFAASTEVAREQIKARLAGHRFDPKMMAQLDNPLWNRPYEINNMGEVEILAPLDERWASVYQRNYVIPGIVKPDPDFKPSKLTL